MQDRLYFLSVAALLLAGLLAEGRTSQKRNGPNRPANAMSEENAHLTTVNSNPPMSTSTVYTDIPRASQEQPHAVGVVVANARYEHPDLPNVDYALRDAQAMTTYLVRAFGVREENLLVEKNATRSVLERIFGSEEDPDGQIQEELEPGTSDVFVYYSGHAAVHSESGNAYFMPSDGTPDSTFQSGYSARQFYETLVQLSARSVTVVLEASRVETTKRNTGTPNVTPAVRLLQNHENQIASIESGLVFSAGAANPVSTRYNGKERGVLTHFFLKGLRGDADASGNGAITGTEMASYLTQSIPYRAQRTAARKQTPQVAGTGTNRVLIRYKSSE